MNPLSLISRLVAECREILAERSSRLDNVTRENL